MNSEQCYNGGPTWISLHPGPLAFKQFWKASFREPFFRRLVKNQRPEEMNHEEHMAWLFPLAPRRWMATEDRHSASCQRASSDVRRKADWAGQTATERASSSDSLRGRGRSFDVKSEDGSFLVEAEDHELSEEEGAGDDLRELQAARPTAFETQLEEQKAKVKSIWLWSDYCVWYWML